MKSSTILILCAAIVLVVADDRKGPQSHQDQKQHEAHGPQQQLKKPQDQHHQAPQQHQLKQQPAHDQHHQAPAVQQHSLKQQPQVQQPAGHKHKREAPKDVRVPEGDATTAAPKATVDPKQPSLLPAIVSQPPKNKRDTVPANPPTRTTTNNNQQRKPQSAQRPTSGTKVNRDQTAKAPQTTDNLKAPATVNQEKAPAAAQTPAQAAPATKV